MTNKQFLDYYSEAIIQEKKSGTFEAISYIIKNGKDKELIETMNELINEYLEIYYNADGKVVLSIPDIPDILANKLLEKQERMKREKMGKKYKTHKTDKEIKMIIAKDTTERIN